MNGKISPWKNIVHPISTREWKSYARVFREVISISQFGKDIYETEWPIIAILQQLMYDISFFLALKGRGGQNGLPGVDGEPGEVVSRLMRYK